MQCQTNFLCVTFILIFDHAENLIECFSHEMKFVHVDYIWLFVFFVECWPELRRFKKEKRWMRDDHLHLYVFLFIVFVLFILRHDLIWFDSIRFCRSSASTTSRSIFENIYKRRVGRTILLRMYLFFSVNMMQLQFSLTVKFMSSV